MCARCAVAAAAASPGVLCCFLGSSGGLGHGRLMDDQVCSVTRDVKEPGQGEAASLGRCHGFHVQLSGSLAWTWADGPTATRSIRGVPAWSGGPIVSSRVTWSLSPSGLGA